MNFKQLKTQIFSCQKCQLCKTRRNVVPGQGNEKADILFIGEGPGKNEDLQGKPFVGSSGKFLSQMLATISLKREEVYITNVVKCRPPKNRDPLSKEVNACWRWLEIQINLISPKLIVPLGRNSAMRFIPDIHISSDHGKVFKKEIPAIGKVLLYPCYHPAAALYNGTLRQTLIKDFEKIPLVLDLAKKK